jgi:hypothetical protein
LLKRMLTSWILQNSYNRTNRTGDLPLLSRLPNQVVLKPMRPLSATVEVPLTQEPLACQRREKMWLFLTLLEPLLTMEKCLCSSTSWVSWRSNYANRKPWNTRTSTLNKFYHMFGSSTSSHLWCWL